MASPEEAPPIVAPGLVIPGGLTQWREKTRSLGIPQLKGLVLRIQQALNEMDFEKMPTLAERQANERVLEMLLRRQTILVGELRRRGFHSYKDAKDLHDWLEKEAKPGRKVF